MFYFSKKSLMNHANNLFNNIKYCRSLLHPYIMVSFQKRRKETANQKLILDPSLIIIDFDYASQLLVITIILVLIPK